MMFNLFLILFLLGMAYYWGSVQGLFSGLLHLVAVVAAGALAFALWEPFVLGFLIYRMPDYAWGVGLIAPFLLYLVLIRLGLDYFIPGNMHFSIIVNMIVGGVFGFCAAVLTAGIFIIGLNHLTLPDNVLGYQPLSISEQGSVVANEEGDLWINVDQMTSDFYSRLSNGMLYAGAPIPLYRSDIARLAQLSRLKLDINSSGVARQESVSLLTHYVRPLPVADLRGSIQDKLTVGSPGDHQLVLIDTKWEVSSDAPGTYDADGILRVPSTQVRLIAVHPMQGDAIPQLFAPKGVAVLSKGNIREFIPLDNQLNFAQLSGKGQLNWVFILPAELKSSAILIRGLRFELPDPTVISAEQVVNALGMSTEEKAAYDKEEKRRQDASKTAVKTPTDTPAKPAVTSSAIRSNTNTASSGANAQSADVVKVELTSNLPRPISSNLATGLEFQKQEVFGGEAEVGANPFNLAPDVRVDNVMVPSSQMCVRVRVLRDQAQTIFGKARALASMAHPLFLSDDANEQYYPVGYVWVKSVGVLRIKVDRTAPIMNARGLPIADMQSGDELYLYFMIPKGVRIQSCSLGPRNRIKVELNSP